MKITLYSKPNNELCEKVATEMTEAGYEFDEIDITEDEQGAILVDSIVAEVPVVVLDTDKTGIQIVVGDYFETIKELYEGDK